MWHPMEIHSPFPATTPKPPEPTKDTMSKRAVTEYPIHDILATRWSPRSFDPTAVLSPADLGPAFEAARWAPSANNLQPWQFIVGYRGDETFAKIAEDLSGFNAGWAPDAGALVVAVTNTITASGRDNAYARYDLGQSVAHFTIQATANGHMTHQMGGFDIDALTVALGVSEPWEIVSLIAVGALGDPNKLPEDRREAETGPRARKPLTEVVR
jgi:nitroreductase